MKCRYVLVILLTSVFFGINPSAAQEFRANVVVQAGPKMNSSTDRKVFTTLQVALAEFINNRRWSNDNYTIAERIECNFLLNVTEALGNNVYKATLTVQATRPVYNSSYATSLINTQDAQVTFRYVEFQPLEFNEQRIAANDPLESNLTAVVAYYIQVILGLDNASFSANGGEANFRKAQHIVNNAPDGKDVAGWKSFEGNRNRYWLQDNLNNSKFQSFHQVMYQYHREGLDIMYEKPELGRAVVLNCMHLLMRIHEDTPNSMLLQMFFNAKSDELIKIFAGSPPQEKQRAIQILSQLDVPNANKYQQLR
jgi:hypothetical protein